MKSWIGVDLDGTLAKDDFLHAQDIGEPVERMVAFVKSLIEEGHTVKVFTARANPIGYASLRELRGVIRAIEEWTLTHIGQELEVTCCKDYAMIALFDDRAFRVEKNRGHIHGWKG